MKKVETTSAPKAIGPYSQAIICKNLVYTSGQVALVPETGDMVHANITTQTKQVCENLKHVLEEAGSSLNRVIKTTCFLKNINDFAEFNTVYAKHFTEKPARSTIEVSNLPKNALVEIEVIAELDG